MTSCRKFLPISGHCNQTITFQQFIIVIFCPGTQKNNPSSHNDIINIDQDKNGLSSPCLKTPTQGRSTYFVGARAEHEGLALFFGVDPSAKRDAWPQRPGCP